MYPSDNFNTKNDHTKSSKKGVSKKAGAVTKE